MLLLLSEVQEDNWTAFEKWKARSVHGHPGTAQGAAPGHAPVAGPCLHRHQGPSAQCHGHKRCWTSQTPMGPAGVLTRPG